MEVEAYKMALLLQALEFRRHFYITYYRSLMIVFEDEWIRVAIHDA